MAVQYHLKEVLIGYPDILLNSRNLCSMKMGGVLWCCSKPAEYVQLGNPSCRKDDGYEDGELHTHHRCDCAHFSKARVGGEGTISRKVRGCRTQSTQPYMGFPGNFL